MISKLKILDLFELFNNESECSLLDECNAACFIKIVISVAEVSRGAESALHQLM